MHVCYVCFSSKAMRARLCSVEAPNPKRFVCSFYALIIHALSLGRRGHPCVGGWSLWLREVGGYCRALYPTKSARTEHTELAKNTHTQFCSMGAARFWVPRTHSRKTNVICALNDLVNTIHAGTCAHLLSLSQFRCHNTRYALCACAFV